MEEKQSSVILSYRTVRTSQFEQILKEHSQSTPAHCKQKTSVEMPRVSRSLKHFPTGSKYEGTWDVFGMSGKGRYTFLNGVVYEGEFSDGMFHGAGELRYPSGAVLRGKWDKGDMVERTLIFADGLEYMEKDWTYCTMPDRRFTIEYTQGLQPAGASFLTAKQPSPGIPEGCYDTVDGFYDPKLFVVTNPEDANEVLRVPSHLERNWIVANCRRAWDEPCGPRPDLYEEWTDPQHNYENPTESTLTHDSILMEPTTPPPCAHAHQSEVADDWIIETCQECVYGRPRTTSITPENKDLLVKPKFGQTRPVHFQVFDEETTFYVDYFKTLFGE